MAQKHSTSKTAHIMCILDMSGSMSGTQTEIVNSFNTFVDEQKAERGNAKLTLVFFDDRYEIIYDRVDIKSVQHITKSMYQPRGMTALYDAVGRTINAHPDDAGFVLIQTDGYENASHKFNKSSIKKLIGEKETQGWDFLFLGADIDASEQGGNIGLGSKSVQFDKTSAGIEVAYSAMSAATSNYRASLDTDILTPGGQ